MRDARSALVLASGSPRRRELLEGLGFQLEIIPPDVDETPREGEDPRDYVLRLARAKAEWVSKDRREAVVIAADTAVVLGSEILGKPRDANDAAAMLARLAGRDHRVLTGVATASGGTADAMAVETRVQFRPLSAEEIRWYVKSGEPLDKAGAYAIQGLGGAFVRAIEGSVSNVVGLPVAEALELLAARGCALPWTER